MSTSMDEARQMAQEMRDEREPDYELKEFRCYALGLCYASVCTSLSPEDAVERMNQDYPTGLASGGQWHLSEEKKFEGGELNHGQCPDAPDTHKHYLMVC